MNATIKNLTVEEKILLLQELLTDIEIESPIGLTEAQKDILDERKRNHRKSPKEGLSIEEFKVKYLS